MAGRPRGAQTIVAEDHVSYADEIVPAETYNIDSFIFEEPMDVLEWLASRRLISNFVLCEICQGRCTLTKSAQVTDGFR